MRSLCPLANLYPFYDEENRISNFAHFRNKKKIHRKRFQFLIIFATLPFFHQSRALAQRERSLSLSLSLFVLSLFAPIFLWARAQHKKVSSSTQNCRRSADIKEEEEEENMDWFLSNRLLSLSHTQKRAQWTEIKCSHRRRRRRRRRPWFVFVQSYQFFERGTVLDMPFSRSRRGGREGRLFLRRWTMEEGVGKVVVTMEDSDLMGNGAMMS